MPNGFSIFTGAIGALLRHPHVVLQITLVLFLINLAIEAWDLRNYITYAPTGFSTVLLTLANWALVSIVAVSWHRFVLRDEHPHGLFPHGRAGLWFRYFISWFVLGIVAGLITVAVGFVFFMLFNLLAPFAQSATGLWFQLLEGGSGQGYGFIALAACVLGWVFLYALFRLGMGLPHLAAYGDNLAMGASLARTRPLRGAIAVTAALASLGQAGLLSAMMLPYAFVTPSAQDLYLALVFQVALYVIMVLCGAALLTRIYQASEP